MKNPTHIPPPPVVEEQPVVKEKSPSPVIKKRKEGISIAPPKYSHMSTEELEKLLWN